VLCGWGCVEVCWGLNDDVIKIVFTPYPLATHHTPRPIHTHTSTHAHTRSTYITLPAPHTHLHTHTHSAPPNTLLPTLARTQYPSSSRVFKTFFTNNCYFFRLKIDVLSFHVNVIEWSFL
jgi:hypothetical protein